MAFDGVTTASAGIAATGGGEPRRVCRRAGARNADETPGALDAHAP